MYLSVSRHSWRQAEVVKEMTSQVQLLLLCSLSGADQCICPFLDTPGGGLRLSKR